MVILNLRILVGRFTLYQYMVVFLAILQISGALFYEYGISSLFQTLIAAASAVALDAVLEFFKTKKWSVPQSAVISGLFIGGILATGTAWYVCSLAGFAAIASKHLIKFKSRPVFNPANFGILFAYAAFGARNTWWISSPLILVLVFGIFIVWRFRRFGLVISFLLCFFIVNSLLEMARGSAAAAIYYTLINGGTIYFFSMFMLIEPRTHPRASWKMAVYGILVAAIYLSISFLFNREDLIIALAFGNILVPLLDNALWPFGKKQSGNGAIPNQQ